MTSTRAHAQQVGATQRRGFTYVLEPLHHQRSWQLEQARLLLAQAQKHLADQERELGDLRATHRSSSQEAMHAWARRVEPAAHTRALAYLSNLHAEIEDRSHTVASSRASVVRLEQAYIEAHRRLDAIEKHREAALQEHEAEQLRQQAAEADREWLARRSLRPSDCAVTAHLGERR